MYEFKNVIKKFNRSVYSNKVFFPQRVENHTADNILFIYTYYVRISCEIHRRRQIFLHDLPTYRYYVTYYLGS